MALDAHLLVGQIHQRRAAGLQLGEQALLEHEAVVAAAAPAEHADGNARGFGAAAGALQQLARDARLAFFLKRFHAHHVAFVAHQTAQPHAVELRSAAAERRRVIGRDAAAVQVDVDVDQHIHNRPRGLRLLRDHREVGLVIHGDAELGALRQLDQPRDLSLAHHLVGDQQVVESALGHRFGLGNFGAGQADRAALDQEVGELGRLTGLDVRTPSDAGAPAGGRHPTRVVLEGVEVHQQRGRVERFDGQAGRVVVHCARII